MKLLISPRDAQEAKDSVEGGADIIDVKNPVEGSLGAGFPWIIRDIQNVLPAGLELSATLGDLGDKPGFASLAAKGLSRLGVDYIKAGLLVGEEDRVRYLAKSILRAVDKSEARVVLAGYGEHKRLGSIDPLKLPELSYELGVYGVMVDTYFKNGHSLFDVLSIDELKKFIHESRKNGLKVALAGCLKEEDIPTLKNLAPDIVGVRGAVCTGNDRLDGRIRKEKVKAFKRMLLS